jgi:hypothetical protein
VVNTSSGVTTIDQSNTVDRQDVLTFGTGISAANLSVTQMLATDGSTTVTIHDSQGKDVVINGYFKGDVDQLSFADGSTASLSAMVAQLTSGTTTTATTAASLAHVTPDKRMKSETAIGLSGLLKSGGQRDQIVAGNSNTHISSNRVKNAIVDDSGAQRLSRWTLSDALLSDHLRSGTAALGADLVHHDEPNGNLMLSTAVATLSNSSYGKTAQNLDVWSDISKNRLH